MQNIINNISSLMQEKGMTQKELAQKTSFSRPYISQLLSKKKTLGTEHIKIFAKALDVSIPDLMKTNSVLDEYQIKMCGDFSSRRAKSVMRKVIVEMENYALSQEKQYIGQ